MDTINLLDNWFQQATDFLGEDKVVAVLGSVSAAITVLGFVVEYLFSDASLDTRFSLESNLKSAQNEDDYPDWLLENKKERNRAAIVRKLVFSYFHWGFLPLRKGILSRGAGQKPSEKGGAPSWRSTLLLCFLCTLVIRATIFFASLNAPDKQQHVCHSVKLTLSAGLVLFLFWLCVQLINGWQSNWRYESLSDNHVTEVFMPLIDMLFMAGTVCWLVGLVCMFVSQWKQENLFLKKNPS